MSCRSSAICRSIEMNACATEVEEGNKGCIVPAKVESDSEPMQHYVSALDFPPLDAFLPVTAEPEEHAASRFPPRTSSPIDYDPSIPPPPLHQPHEQQQERQCGDAQLQEPQLIDQEQQESQLIDQVQHEPQLIDLEQQEPQLIDLEQQEPQLIDLEQQEPQLIDLEQQESQLIDQELQESQLIDQEQQESQLIDQEQQESQLIDLEQQESQLIDQEQQEPQLIDQHQQGPQHIPPQTKRRHSYNSIMSAVSSGFNDFCQQADMLFTSSTPVERQRNHQQQDGAASGEPPPLTDVRPVRPTLDQLAGSPLPPVVLVHGLFGFGPDEMLTPKGRLHYWETAIDCETNFHGLLVLEAAVGPVSSQHDRACELFAQIVGIQVDYGESHSTEHGHQRFGRDYTGRPLYPWWSAEKPIHLVGHSAGGNTIRWLQYLLLINFWDRGTSPDWIKSVTCIVAPLKGSTATYLLGCSLETGLFGLSSLVPMVSIVDTLGALVGFPRAERRRMILWKLEHFGIQQEDFAEFNRLKRRMADSGFLLGKDNLAYDLTLQSCQHMNAIVPDFPGTYYFTYTADCASSTHVKAFLAAPFLYMRNRNFDRKSIPCCTHGDWRRSDGMVPLASQVHPAYEDNAGLPRETGGAIAAAVAAGGCFRPGVWYTESAAAAAGSATPYWDHCDVICTRGLLWEGIVDRIPVVSHGAQALFNLGKQLGGLRKDRSSFARVNKAEQRRFYEYVYARLSSLK